jgi:hypothetical protein
LVSLVADIPVFTFTAVTSTPGIRAPVLSETVPPTLALTWANVFMGWVKSSNPAAMITITFRVISYFLLN